MCDLTRDYIERPIFLLALVLDLISCDKVAMKDSSDQVVILPTSESPVLSSSSRDEDLPMEKKKSLRRRIRAVVWDTLDRSPEERRFLAKIDFFILTWAGFTYFSKNLNTNNICK